MALFTDLNIVFPSEKKKLQNVIETAAHLGYSSVAINHVADFQEKKREIGKPTSPETLFSTLPIVQGTSKPIRVLNRLTLVVSDHSHCNELRATSPRTRLYDVVAVFPKTEKLFHAACTSLDVDLICINVTEKQPFPVRRPAVNANIIISSAAENPLELRGPYDVANLGLLFGLSEQDAKAAVSSNCRAAILHGETRRTAFGVIYTMKKAQVVKNQMEADKDQKQTEQDLEKTEQDVEDIVPVTKKARTEKV
ncbi:ribonuclease P protein subunit p30 isoform X2 [Latimeria chalumnae]|uniref:ribonuclease P protein subunit p30 isoform X2 n=1 Tax=Latimeria chalumnae TaxID=7897 RepID=UPI00313B779D